MMQGSDSKAFAYDSFVRVNPRKKRKAKDRRDAITPSDLWTRAQEELTADSDWLLDCKEIFHTSLGDAKPRRVLCLGLGSPSSSRDARAQLALLSSLCVSSDIDAANISVYDPVFTDADRQLFHLLGMQCLDHVQGVEHSLNCPTMLYMPHCDLELYERVIRANWTLDGLCNVVFVANCFRDYVDNNAATKLMKNAPCLMRLVPLLDCRALPTSQTFPNAFNNLCVQRVGHSPLSHQDEAFWKTTSTR